jgi:hypothetical protein
VSAAAIARIDLLDEAADGTLTIVAYQTDLVDDPAHFAELEAQ